MMILPTVHQQSCMCTLAFSFLLLQAIKQTCGIRLFNMHLRMCVYTHVHVCVYANTYTCAVCTIVHVIKKH